MATIFGNIGGGATGSEGLVEVSSNDTTAGFLDDKLVVSTGLTKTILNGGGDEDLQLAIDATANNPYGVTLQQVYDESTTVPQITVNGTPDPVGFRASVTGAVLQVQDTAGANIFEVDDTFVEVDGNLRIVDAFPNHAALFSLNISDTYTTGAAFIGGAMQSDGTITYNNAVSIFATFGEVKRYIAAVGPGFAAYTMMQGLPVFNSGTGFDQINVLGINMGPTAERATAGTSTVTNTTGFSFVPQTRALVVGAIQTKTDQIAVSVRPTFSTVGFSTANLGTICGVDVSPPVVALFQPSAGTETLTAQYGLRMRANTFTSTGNKAAVFNEMTDAADRFCILNTGGARSDFGDGQLQNCGQITQPTDLVGRTIGGGSDWQDGWGASNFYFWQFNALSDQLRFSNPSADRFLFDTDSGNTVAEFNFNCHKFSLGAQTGAVGNQVGVFVAPTRSTSVAGEWSDFLLTQAGNITLNAAMTLVAGWTINAPSITLGTGSVTTAAALNVGGNPNQGTTNRVGVRIISNPSGGSGVNAALWVTAGRTRLDGVLDINNGVALGGGATATLGTIGGSGPTTAAQAQWVQIEVNGVNHWIPAWT